MNDKNWRRIVEKAELYLALDQRDHYLRGDNDADYPWQYAVSCEPGGSHRIDISTNVWFSAEHPSGLRFRWSFDIEPYSANGKSSYEIDVNGIRAVLRKLEQPCSQQFRAHLMKSADAVAKNAAEYKAVWEREEEVVRFLRSLA